MQQSKIFWLLRQMNVWKEIPIQKAYLAAMEELMHDSASDDNASKKEQEPSVKEDDKSDTSDYVNNLAAHAARMMSSLKE